MDLLGHYISPDVLESEILYPFVKNNFKNVSRLQSWENSSDY